MRLVKLKTSLPLILSCFRYVAHSSAPIKVLHDSDASISMTITTSAYIPLCLSHLESSDTLTSTNVPTLCALLANPSSSAHIFITLNNAAYLSHALCTPLPQFHELDWWDEHLLQVSLPSDTGG